MYTAAIAQAHLLVGYDSPKMDGCIVRKMKRAVVEATPPPATKNPLRMLHFLQMFEHIGPRGCCREA